MRDQSAGDSIVSSCVQYCLKVVACPLGNLYASHHIHVVLHRLLDELWIHIAYETDKCSSECSR